MSEITIRGLITTTELKRGEEVTVEHTEHIDALIESGYVKRVQKVGPDGRTELERFADEEAARVKAELGVPDDDETREVWRKFLQDKGIQFNQSDSKAKLIELWRNYDPDDQAPATADDDPATADS